MGEWRRDGEASSGAGADRAGRDIAVVRKRWLLALAFLVLGLGGWGIASHLPVVPGLFLKTVRFFDGLVRQGLRELTHDVTGWRVALLFGASCLYGVIHAAGPGHGKALMAAYVLQKRQNPGDVVLLAGVMAVVHTLGAVLLAVLFSTVLQGAGSFFKIGLQRQVMAVSGGAIALLGLVMLGQRRRGCPCCGGGESEALKKGAGAVLVGVAAGIVPCPASLILVLFSVSHGVVALGLLAVAGISLGMFLLLVAVGILILRGRDGALQTLEKGGGAERIVRALEIVSPVLIVALGVGMVCSVLW